MIRYRPDPIEYGQIFVDEPVRLMRDHITCEDINSIMDSCHQNNKHDNDKANDVEDCKGLRADF